MASTVSASGSTHSVEGGGGLLPSAASAVQRGGVGGGGMEELLPLVLQLTNSEQVRTFVSFLLLKYYVVKEIRFVGCLLYSYISLSLTSNRTITTTTETNKHTCFHFSERSRLIGTFQKTRILCRFGPCPMALDRDGGRLVARNCIHLSPFDTTHLDGACFESSVQCLGLAAMCRQSCRYPTTLFGSSNSLVFVSIFEYPE